MGEAKRERAGFVFVFLTCFHVLAGREVVFVWNWNSSFCSLECLAPTEHCEFDQFSWELEEKGEFTNQISNL